MMIASEQANFDAHDWTGQLMLTSEQANFHHGFGRAWRQICQPIHITARKKKPRERIAIAASNLQNLKVIHIGKIAKKDTASAQKGARGRASIYIGFRENDEFCEFRGAAKSIVWVERGYNNNLPPTAARHETMVLST